MQNNIRIGITQGDINGIGYEVILKTLNEKHIFDTGTPIVYGSPKVVAYHKKVLGLHNITFSTIKNADEAFANKPNIVNCNDDAVRVELGKPTPFSGTSAFEALEKATEELMARKIDVLITAPINKNNVNEEGFKHPGHTEYLTEKFGTRDSLMLMVGEEIKIGVVTGHIPINKVTEQITTSNILKKLRVLNRCLIEDFGIDKPTIAVLGLNPHAGDEGLLGSEEQTQIIPAIKRAREEGLMAMGPYPADGFFGKMAHRKFDAVLAMYHDQGLTPFKLLCFEDGVNYTAGLPFIRTSPGHGTAYDLAGKNLASPVSFMHAVFLAVDIFKNRKEYRELKSNAIKYDEVQNIISKSNFGDDNFELKDTDTSDPVEILT